MSDANAALPTPVAECFRTTRRFRRSMSSGCVMAILWKFQISFLVYRTSLFARHNFIQIQQYVGRKRVGRNFRRGQFVRRLGFAERDELVGFVFGLLATN